MLCRIMAPEAHFVNNNTGTACPERDRSPVAAAPNADETCRFWPILTLERAASREFRQPTPPPPPEQVAFWRADGKTKRALRQQPMPR